MPPFGAIDWSHAPGLVLGASGATGGQASGGAVVSTLVWAGVLIGVAVIAGLGLLAYRRRVFREETGRDVTGGLLEDLRQAVREGRMTTEEFEAAKRAMAMRLRGEGPSREIPKPPMPRPRPPEGLPPSSDENPGGTREGPGPKKGGSRPGS
ncbi:MAG: hypothetical protein EA378_09105 [Phycisphaerales bacterium]|nr:MAG: hypothetical protein EA378_09105 [Phycisphaerales bacterium]